MVLLVIFKVNSSINFIKKYYKKYWYFYKKGGINKMELLRIIAAGGCGIVIGLTFGYIVGSDRSRFLRKGFSLPPEKGVI